MDDIVTQLGRTKLMQDADIETLCDQAADEIERLRKENDIKNYRLDDAVEQIKKLQHQNTRLHLDLMIAYSEIAGLYDDNDKK